MQNCDGTTLAEAAIRLGTTPDAVRKRIKRGTFQGYKADDGRWLARLNGTGHGPDTDSQVDDERVDGEVDADTLAAYRELVATLQAELAAVRAELIRHDQLLAVALQRVPALLTQAQQVSAQERVRRARGGNSAAAENKLSGSHMCLGRLNTASICRAPLGRGCGRTRRC